MPQYIKKIRTSSGDLKIDYEALANLPKLGALAPKNKVGKYDLANDALDGYATTDYVDKAIKNVDVDLTDYATKNYVDSYRQYSQGLSYNLKSNNEYEVTGIGSCTDKDIIIPSIIDGKRITSIGSYAFWVCDSLTSIIIPDSVTSIGDSAFSQCASLTNVIIGNSVTSIGSDAFAGCSSLTSITIPDSVKSIDNYAFASCYALTSITIPDGVTAIGMGVFVFCSGLTNIDIPDSVTSIGNRAFEGCSSLTSITIPNSITSISSDAFNDCTNLTIYCEAESKPAGWNSTWNPDNRPVIWNAVLDFVGVNEKLAKIPTPTPADAGKFLMVDENGNYVLKTIPSLDGVMI